MIRQITNWIASSITTRNNEQFIITSEAKQSSMSTNCNYTLCSQHSDTNDYIISKLCIVTVHTQCHQRKEYPLNSRSGMEPRPYK